MASQIFEYLVSLHLYWNIVPCLTVTPSMCKHRPVSLPEHSMYCTYIAAWFGRFRFLLVKASSLVYIWQKKTTTTTTKKQKKKSCVSHTVSRGSTRARARARQLLSSRAPQQMRLGFPTFSIFRSISKNPLAIFTAALLF